MVSPICIEEKDENTKIIYRFTVLDTDLVCTQAIWYNKNGKKWIQTNKYDQYESRYSTVKKDDFILPHYICNEAKQKFIDLIYVGKWNRN